MFDCWSLLVVCCLLQVVPLCVVYCLLMFNCCSWFVMCSSLFVVCCALPCCVVRCFGVCCSLFVVCCVCRVVIVVGCLY